MDLNADRLGSDAQRSSFFANRAPKPVLVRGTARSPVLGQLVISDEFG